MNTFLEKFLKSQVNKKILLIEETFSSVLSTSLKQAGKCNDYQCILTEGIQQLFNQKSNSSEKLTEALGDVDNIFIMEGLVLQEAGAKNNNKRVYPVDILREAVEEAQPVVKSRQMIGELDHTSALRNPESPLPLIEKASHLIYNLWMEGKFVKGDIMLLPTKYGKHLLDLLKVGTRVGISLRGIGEVNNLESTVTKLKILTYDFVSYPSYEGVVAGIENVEKVKSTDLIKKWKEMKLL